MRPNGLRDVGIDHCFHKKLFGEVWEWAGQYRRTEKNIGVDPVQMGVRLYELLNDWTAGADLASIGPRRSAYLAALRAADAHDYAPLLRFARVGGTPSVMRQI